MMTVCANWGTKNCNIKTCVVYQNWRINKSLKLHATNTTTVELKIITRKCYCLWDNTRGLWCVVVLLQPPLMLLLLLDFYYCCECNRIDLLCVCCAIRKAQRSQISNSLNYKWIFYRNVNMLMHTPQIIKPKSFILLVFIQYLTFLLLHTNGISISEELIFIAHFFSLRSSRLFDFISTQFRTYDKYI